MTLKEVKTKVCPQYVVYSNSTLFTELTGLSSVARLQLKQGPFQITPEERDKKYTEGQKHAFQCGKESRQEQASLDTVNEELAREIRFLEHLFFINTSKLT